MKQEKGVLVNGEELLALKNLVENHQAEINILKRAVDSQQKVINEVAKNFFTLNQGFQLLRDEVSIKINNRRR
jgi:hypothetical protein